MHADQLAEFRNKRLGFVFQFFNLLPILTVLEIVQTPMMLAASIAQRVVFIKDGKIASS